MSPAVRWISIIVGLLAGNAIAVFVLIGAAGGDTSRRVVPDYYDQAAHWDDRMAEAAASARLGWRGEVVAHGRTLDLTLVAAAPVSGAVVVVRGTPRGRADELHQITLTEVSPGHYRGNWPAGRGGLHQLSLVADRGPDRWVADRIVDLGGPGTP